MYFFVTKNVAYVLRIYSLRKILTFCYITKLDMTKVKETYYNLHYSIKTKLLLKFFFN